MAHARAYIISNSTRVRTRIKITNRDIGLYNAIIHNSVFTCVCMWVLIFLPSLHKRALQYLLNLSKNKLGMSLQYKLILK